MRFADNRMARILAVLIVLVAGNAHAQSLSPKALQSPNQDAVSRSARVILIEQSCLGPGERTVLILAHTAAGAAVGLAASATVSLLGGSKMNRTIRYLVPVGAVVGFVAGIRVTSGRETC